MLPNSFLTFLIRAAAILQCYFWNFSSFRASMGARLEFQQVLKVTIPKLGKVFLEIMEGIKSNSHQCNLGKYY